MHFADVERAVARSRRQIIDGEVQRRDGVARRDLDREIRERAAGRIGLQRERTVERNPAVRIAVFKGDRTKDAGVASPATPDALIPAEPPTIAIPSGPSEASKPMSLALALADNCMRVPVWLVGIEVIQERCDTTSVEMSRPSESAAAAPTERFSIDDPLTSTRSPTPERPRSLKSTCSGTSWAAVLSSNRSNRAATPWLVSIDNVDRVRGKAERGFDHRFQLLQASLHR